MYDPTIGRWLEEDPEGLAPDPNDYRFVGNDPTNETDPSGMEAQVPQGGMSAAQRDYYDRLLANAPSNPAPLPGAGQLVGAAPSQSIGNPSAPPAGPNISISSADPSTHAGPPAPPPGAMSAAGSSWTDGRLAALAAQVSRSSGLGHLSDRQLYDLEMELRQSRWGLVQGQPEQVPSLGGSNTVVPYVPNSDRARLQDAIQNEVARRRGQARAEFAQSGHAMGADQAVGPPLPYAPPPGGNVIGLIPIVGPAYSAIYYFSVGDTSSGALNAMSAVLDLGTLGVPLVRGVRGFVILGELDHLGRPTGVYARISRPITTGGRLNPNIRPPGFVGGPGAVDARGHLLARQLGGPGNDVRNLVTIIQNPANSPAMRSFESEIRAAVEAGQTVDYWVTPIYEGNNLIPRGITLRARGSSGLSFDVSILNR